MVLVLFFFPPCLKVLVLFSHHILFSHLGMFSSFLHLFASIQLCSEVLAPPKIVNAPVLATSDNLKSFIFFVLIMRRFGSLVFRF